MDTPRPKKKGHRGGVSRREMLAGALALTAGCRTPSGEDSGVPLDTADTGRESDRPMDSDPADTGDTGVEPEPFDLSPYTEDPGLFPTAVMAGIVEQTSIRLACTVADLGDVRVVVWDDTQVLVHDVDATPSDTGALQLDVEGLEPGRWYGYAFLREDERLRSIAGRFHTAPDDAALEPLTLALSACNGSGNDPWPILSVIAEEDVHLLLHLGDMVYNDGRTTAEEFRENWRWYLSGDGYREAYARSGLLATWDDHEVTNDWDPDSVDPDTVAKALETYFEHIPVWRGEDGQIWRSYRWGLTAEIFVLDCRSERVPGSRLGDAAQYISTEQMEWLKAALAASPCVFKVVMNSVPITDMPSLWDVAAADRWEGYAAQRDELLFELSAQGIDDVYFVAGDFHVNFVALVEPRMGGAAGRTWEIACTSGNNNPLGEWLVDTAPDQFTFGTQHERAVLLDLDPTTKEVTVRFLNQNGDLDEEQVLSQ
ncbi:MAG: hypothetical protein GY913_12715 [Proteobacteria bacterium]|nr:hypothetical protein [Pseudomonadota bacterium]MCP4917768.1 hypothetical protein [Pseudomonadota bacterium]